MTVNLKTKLFGRVYQFKNVKEVLAKANEEKSGDRLAGIIAESMEERIAAKHVLANLTVADLRNNPVIPYEQDEVTRIIQDDVNERIYSEIAQWTLSDLREWILCDETSGDDIKRVSRGLTSEVVAGVAKLMTNLDLVYGAAGETIDQWDATLAATIALDPHHVSAYALTVEAGTPLAADPSRHPDDDTQADAYQLATDRLGAAGYDWYEISNWSKPGHECRHNLLYWTEGEYLAIGCAAHGHVDGRRYWNHRTPERFIAAIEEGRSPESGSEVLDTTERRVEGLQLAIRTRSGVPASEVADETVSSLEGLVERTADDRVVLTPAGRLLANEVAIRLE